MDADHPGKGVTFAGRNTLRFLTRIAPSLIGTQGGDRAGTAANAFTGTVMGKANDAKQAAEWMKYGLLDPKQTITKSGKTVAWRAGAVKDTNLALSNPLEWAEKVALPAMKAKGVNVDDRMELTKVLGTMFRNQNANMFANEIMQAQQRSRLHKDEGGIDKAGTLDDIYKRNLSQDPTAAMTAMSASLENFMTVLSKAAMPTIASGLTSLATGIEAISNALHDHPLAATGGGAVVAGASLYASGKAAYNLSNGFGLSTSAVALDGSAAALDAAAVRLGVAGEVSTAEHAADKFLAGGTGAAEAGSLAKTGGKAAGILGLGTIGSVGLVAGTGLAAGAGMIYGSLAWKQAHPEEFHAHAQHAYGMDGPKPEPEKIFVSHPRRGSSGDWVDNPKFKPPQPSLASQFTPIGGFNPANPFGKGAAAPPQKVDVTIEPPAPVKMTFEVVPSSVLLQIVEQSKTAALQLKAHADTGPGGLGETHTGQH